MDGIRDVPAAVVDRFRPGLRFVRCAHRQVLANYGAYLNSHSFYNKTERTGAARSKLSASARDVHETNAEISNGEETAADLCRH